MSLTPKCPRCSSQGICACQSNYKTIHENKNKLEQFYNKAEKLNITYISDIFSIIEKLIIDNSDNSELGSKVRQLFSEKKE